MPQFVIALDVGGTAIKAALVDHQLSVVDSVVSPTPQGHDAVLSAMAEVITRLHDASDEANSTAVAIGAVVPGIVDDETAFVRHAANLDFDELPIGKLLGQRISALGELPIAIGHDVRAGGLAEFTIGAGVGANNGAFVPIGTGIAAAMVIDGSLVHADGYAGELGHLPIARGDLRCGCGQIGCVETIASASAIGARYAARTGDDSATAETVVGRLAHDEIAREVWRDAIDTLADALTVLITLNAPEVVVIGGGLANAGAALFDPLREKLLRRLTFQRRPTITRARFGHDAGTIGAAILAWRAAGKPIAGAPKFTAGDSIGTS